MGKLKNCNSKLSIKSNIFISYGINFRGSLVIDLKVIKKMAYDLMAGKRSHPGKEKGDKYYHGERVATTVI